MKTKRTQKLIIDNQLKGNWGEQFIAAELASQGCLIRHVPQGHDSGVDLYCETTWNGIPWLHFWCQVKTEKRWTGKRKKVSKSFEVRDIEYWLKQPIPGLIFLVPDLRDRKKIPYYICSPLHSNNGSTTSFLKIESRRDLFNFLHHTLRELTHEWDLRNGQVSPFPYPLPSNVIEFLPGVTRKYENIIFDSLCWTLWRLSTDILFPRPTSEATMLSKTDALTGDESARLKDIKPYIEALNALISSKGDKHHEGYYIIGLYCELGKNFHQALDYFEKAREITDSHLKDNPSVSSLLSFRLKIDKCIKRVSDKIKLSQN